MKTEIIKATSDDIQLIHEMQIISFRPLLDEYQDFDMSPGNESRERIEERFKQSFTDYLLIKYDGLSVGAVRIIKKESQKCCRVSPIFILPQYQGKRIAQEVFRLIENKYLWATKWELDTIKEELGNCYLYEKIGYPLTGKSEKIKENMTIVYYEKNMNLNHNNHCSTPIV